MRDVEFLRKPSTPATAKDAQVADDLLDTLRANAGKCVGMAANMIGVNKRIIVFEAALGYMEMFNPELLSCSDPYDTEEGCLSLFGLRKAQRYQTIHVRWQNRQMKTLTGNFTGWTAQIIQHEIDHLNGVII